MDKIRAATPDRRESVMLRVTPEMKEHLLLIGNGKAGRGAARVMDAYKEEIKKAALKVEKAS